MMGETINTIKMNFAWVRETQEYARNYIEEKQSQNDTSSPEFVNSKYYSSWMSHHERLCWLEYVLDRDPKHLRENVGSAMQQRLRYMRVSLKMREERFEKCHDGYDLGSIEDYFFAEIFCLFTALYPREAIVPVCRDTNYGRYRGKPTLDHHHGIVCRIFRAYFLDDDVWLAEEIEKLRNEPVSRDMNRSFSLPKSRWYPLIYSLFYGDRESFLKHARWSAKWYSKSVMTSGQIAYPGPNRMRYPPESGDEAYTQPSLIFNYLALAIIKIANAYRGYNLAIDDPFVPMDLLFLS